MNRIEGRIFMTSFAERHFLGKSSVTQIGDIESENFIDKINNELEGLGGELPYLKSVEDGFFPEFSKIIKLENFTDSKRTVIPITIENAQYIRTDYSARTKEELPVLTRWLELPPPLNQNKPAKNLSIAVYSRLKLIEEALASGCENDVKKSKNIDIIKSMEEDLIKILDLYKSTSLSASNGDYQIAADYECDQDRVLAVSYLSEIGEDILCKIMRMTEGWGVVAIMAHDTEDPEPMNPATMTRNALGTEEGGNGTPIDEDAYKKSVEFWRTHVNLKTK